MSRSKRPTPRKAVESPEAQEDALTQRLYELAIDLSDRDGSVPVTGPSNEKEDEFRKIIRKCLNKKHDDILYETLERTRYADSSAFQHLKDSIEETSEIVVFREEEGPDLEVNAFVIPVFAQTKGGLHGEQCFQDQEAFDLLTKSLKEAQLESQDATVVLVSHAYHLDEIDGISFSELNEMVRDAFRSMTSKKATATPAIDRSMKGWPENHFDPEDLTVELRFLVGFALKAVDDPFYQVPVDEAAADRYFGARGARFQQWTQQAAPLVKRCLVTDGTEIEINFLYQDLFHGGKERGIAEYDTLQMMAELHHGLQMHGITPENTKAVIGSTDAGGEMVLRVNLYQVTDEVLVASSEKPLGATRDLQLDTDDAYDALMTIGVSAVALAGRFDADGQPVDVRPYES
jgi:hypothetical protein